MRKYENSIDVIIEQSLISLIREKPYQEIKVAELVESSGIPRSTFYSHFDGIFGAMEHIEKRLLEELHLYVEKDANYGTDQSFSLPTDCMKRWLASCFEHSEEIAIIAGTNGDPYFEVRLRRQIREDIVDMMSDDDLPDKSLWPYVTQMMAASYVALMLYAINSPKDAKKATTEQLVGMMNAIRVGYHSMVPNAARITEARLYGSQTLSEKMT